MTDQAEQLSLSLERPRTRAELERDAVAAAIAAVGAEARRCRPKSVRERNQCEGYSRALEDLSREVRERLAAIDKKGDSE